MAYRTLYFVRNQNVGTALLIRLFFLAILCVIFYFIDSSLFFIYALMPFIFIPILMRTILLPGCLYSAAKMLQHQRWNEAISLLEQSAAFFKQKQWIDQYRFYLLISLRQRSFIESCLCNHAYCLMQLGRVKESKELYENILEQYPENTIAIKELHKMALIVQAAQDLAL